MFTRNAFRSFSLVFAVVFAGACASNDVPVGFLAPCQGDADCADGLFCIAETDGSGVCTVSCEGESDTGTGAGVDSSLCPTTDGKSECGGFETYEDHTPVIACGDPNDQG